MLWIASQVITALQQAIGRTITSGGDERWKINGGRAPNIIADQVIAGNRDHSS